ncbi:MAG: hypothetical protein ABIN67_05190 [Ferruginibacter sp.]
MTKIFLITLFGFIWLTSSFAQSVGIGTTTPDASSILELKSISKGILVPRMTQTERLSIQSPAQGLLVFQVDSIQGFYYYSTLQWQSLTSGLGLILAQPNFSDSLSVYNYNGIKVKDIPTQNITYSTNTKIMDAKFTPDGKSVIVRVKKKTGSPAAEFLYSMNIDGSNVKLLTSQSDQLLLFDVK